MHAKAWAVLLPSERREAGVVAACSTLNAVAAVLGVGSVLPFLTVLSDPKIIENVGGLAWAYERFGFTSTYSFLVSLGVLSLALILLSNAAQILNAYFNSRFATTLQHRFSSSLLACYLRQPLEFFLDRHSGDMESNMFNEAREVVASYYRPVVTLLTSSLVVFGILALALWVNPVVGLLSIGLIGSTYVAIHYFTNRYVRQLGSLRAVASSERHRISGEAIGGIKHIKIENAEPYFHDAFRQLSSELAAYRVRIDLISQLPRFLIHSIIFSGIVILCILSIDAEALASGRALGGLLPMLGVFALAGLRVLPEAQNIHASITQIIYGGSAMDRIHADLAGQPTGSSLFEKASERLTLRRELVLKNVSYTYPNSTTAGVRDISLSLRAGVCVGIVGTTGAGKTTLSNLMLGLLSPSQGHVLADEVPITKASHRAWWRAVGYVPQDVFLLDASILENVAFGVSPSEIDHDRVRDACEAAQLREFIETQLPQEYASKIGERGIRLSGGQRQRIGIARALYHDADLIVLDEATSSLDNQTEREVMNAIGELSGRKTTVIVAHRLSTIKRCDLILVMAEGRILAAGEWDSLMETCEDFRRIALLADVA